MYQLRPAIVLVIALSLILASVVSAQYQLTPTTCSAGQYITWSGSAWDCTTPSGASLPSGLVAHFTGACPTAWTEVTAARGRMIVGLPLSGTSAGTVGTALTDLQDKSTTLTHSGTAVADHASHTHTYNTVIAHTHTLQVQGGTTAATTGTHIMTSVATGGSSRAGTAPETANSTGSASGTTAGPGATLTHAVTQPSDHTVSTSSTLSYIQYRTCSKD